MENLLSFNMVIFHIYLYKIPYYPNYVYEPAQQARKLLSQQNFRNFENISKNYGKFLKIPQKYYFPRVKVPSPICSMFYEFMFYDKLTNLLVLTFFFSVGCSKL